MGDVSHYVGFDLGTKCGICTTSVNWSSGSVTHFPRQWNLGPHKQQRHIEFDLELDDFLGFLQYEQDYEQRSVTICYEKVHRHIGTAAAHVYGAYEMQLLVKCHALGLRNVVFAGVSELKKFATGKGTASKEDMIEAAICSSLRQGLTDNEADAFWCSEWARWRDLNEKSTRDLPRGKQREVPKARGSSAGR